ncbi:SPOR domain-containing protein [Ensifer sp.]|jgi:hypothetical protein|uniref:SPOR domain-containing protein n=1 Tax=Ensifer sp. TaxID=1872086 RepID=UPI002E159BC6|nr:SPOR domain-containing protein [Ensifer sp.]
MADKQFARSGPAEFDVLADDDPLAELARIVGYDARPAVQQLQELQRHQEAVRQDPAFDLEDELLRAFDSYDAPRTGSEPLSQRVDEPQQALEEQIDQPVDEPRFEPAVEPTFEPVAEVAPEPEQEEPIFLQPAPVAVTPELPAADAFAEVQSFLETHYVETAPSAEPAMDEPSFDLERELELSLGEADLLVDVAADTPVAAAEPSVDAWQAPVDDISASWSEPVRAAEPVAAYDEPSFDLPDFDFVADDRIDNEPADAGRGHAVSDAGASVAPQTAEIELAADDLLADVERFPVPPATAALAAAVQSHPALHTSAEPVVAAPAAVAAAPVKKSPYPFTPTFSRATPVASATGASQQRAFAGPIVSSVAPVAAPVAIAATAVAEPPVAAPLTDMARPALEPEHEPSFDIENFEMELSDVSLDLDLSDLSTIEAAPAVAEQAPAQPVVEPTIVPQQHIAPPQVQHSQVQQRERYEETFVASAPVELQETPVESTLPFDPSMISEAENGVAPIAEMDVPQLPVIETEKPAAYPADYDLDIDAEMAQLFGTPAPAPVAKAARAVATEKVEAARPAPAAVGAGALDDFDEFEKAMEEDFRRSMVERKTVTRDAERLSAAQAQDDAGEYREYGTGRRSQRIMLLAASVAGVIILGGAGVYAWMGGSGAATSAEGPKIILADKSPVKVVPEEKGGKTVPNQDKAVYDRVAGAQSGAPQQEALVSSTEEPMDVVQKTLTPESLPLEGSDDTEALPGLPNDDDGDRLLPDGGNAETAAQEEDKTPAVAPRKVRTMIVKPDGTLVAREEPVAAPATDVAGTAQPLPETPSNAVASAAAQGGATLDAAGQASGNVDQVALAATGNANIEQVPVRSVTTTAAAGGEKAPTPQSRPVAQAANTASPAVEQAAVAPETQAAQQVATASVPSGSYFIQVASLPSEAEAQKSYNSLSNKFGNVIGGRGVDIRKAEIAGKGTYYRVRIPAGSKEEANALCSKYKGAGGSCLVTK